MTSNWNGYLEKKKPVGKGKIDVKKNKLIAFDQIEKANLIVEFNKI